MAFPHEKDAIQNLFKSRGAAIYWNNWNKMQHWYHSHMLPQIGKFQVQMQEEMTEKREMRKKMSMKKQKSKRHRKQKKKPNASPAGDIPELQASESAEYMTPEYLEFYKITLHHRNAWKKLKEEMKKEGEDTEYFPDDEGPEERPTLSTAPPSVQAGTERTAELYLLYGSHADTIQSLETQLQAKFDENRVRHQPRLWPVIPLNL